MKNKYILSALLLACGLTVRRSSPSPKVLKASIFPWVISTTRTAGRRLRPKGYFGGCSISDDAIQMISSPYYLKIAYNPDSPTTPGLNYFCLSPSLNTVPFQFVEGEASVSFYIQPDNDPQTTGANYAVQFDDGEQVTASVLFLTDGTIAVADKINGVLQYMPTTATCNAGEDKQLNISVNLQAGTLVYNIQGEDIYSGNTLNGIALERFSVSYDNAPGSVAYFDSMFVFGHNEVLGTDQPAVSTIQLYPNPATEKIKLSGIDGLNGPVSLYGIDGRILPVTAISLSDGTVVFDISGLSQGAYFLSIPSGKGTIKKQFIKQ